MEFPKAFCVVGSHNNVGKTFVSGMVTLGLSGIYWKPIQCGVSPNTDTEDVKEMTGLSHKHFLKESFLFSSSVSPLLESLPIEIEQLVPKSLPKEYSSLVIEGAEGLLMPINENQNFLDFLIRFHLPVFYVAKSEDHEISSTLMALEKIHYANLPLLGVVLNGEPSVEFKRTVESLLKDIPIFEIPYLSKKNPEKLKEYFEKTFLTKMAISA